MRTIPFDLQKALSGAKCVTRYGSSVAGLHVFDANSTYVIYGVTDDRILRCWTKDGMYVAAPGGPSSNDLFLLAEPKLRAWKAEEVPLGAMTKSVRPCDGKHQCRALIVAVNENTVFFGTCGGNHKTFDEMLSENHYSTDGINWKPCGIEDQP